MMQIGRKLILIIGLVWMGSSIIGFGLLPRFHNSFISTVWAFLFRALQGISSSCIQTTSYSIISVLFPDKRNSYIPLIEISIGMGLVVGPLMGSILYSYFGFEMTFLIVGVSFYAMTPLFIFTLPSSINRKDQVVKKVNEENSEEMLGSEYGYESVEYSHIICYKEFIFPAIGAFFAYFVACFGDPVLSLRLAEFNLPNLYYGAFFSWMFIGYVFSSFIVSLALKSYTSRTVIIVGGFFCGLSHALAGPSILLPNSVELMFIGRTLMGLFLTSLIIAPLIEMTDVSIPKYPNHQVKVTDMWAGFFNFSLWLGQTIAPIYGSLMTKFFSYRIWCDVLGIAIVIYWVIYYLFTKARKKRAKPDSIDMERERIDEKIEHTIELSHL